MVECEGLLCSDSFPWGTGHRRPLLLHSGEPGLDLLGS